MGCPDVNEGKCWLFFSVDVWLEGEGALVSPGAAELQPRPPGGSRAALGAQWRVCLGPGVTSSLPQRAGDERVSEGEEITHFQLLTNNSIHQCLTETR